MLSNLATHFKGSAIRKMFNATVGMDGLINFSVGEPDFTTPSKIIDAAVKSFQAGNTHYTPSKGLLSLREAIAEYHAHEFDCDPEKNIMVTAGGTEAIQLALFTVLDPGDEVIVFTPAWPNYFGQIQMIGAKAVEVYTHEKNYFVPDMDDLLEHITSHTKAIIVNTPCNPTGAVYPEETLLNILNIADRYDLYVIADEVYRHIIYDDVRNRNMLQLSDKNEKVIFVNSFSKMFAMTGWRIGYAIASEKIISAMALLHENGISCMAQPLQEGATFALKNCMDEIGHMRDQYNHRRDLVTKLINQSDVISCNQPKGAFYCFVNVQKTGLSSEDFCMNLLHSKKCVVVPGNGFGSNGEGYIRLSYATSEQNIRDGVDRIHQFVDELNL